MKKYSKKQKITIYISLLLIIISTTIIAYSLFTKNTPPQINTSCVIQECHGPFYSCGEPKTYQCTENLRIADVCGQYAVCEEINNDCKLKESPQLTKCQACVTECTSFECVDTCMKKNT